MCFGGSKTPAVVRTDPVEQQRQAEAKASLRTNQVALERQTRRRRTAMLTQGNASGTSGTALGSPGQTTLGNSL